MYEEFKMDELYHFGTKGMKWGVRRYQNKDGTLTSAGKRRKSSMSEDAATAKSLKKKKLNQMSNADLRKLNERQNLERQYKNMNPTSFKRGLNFVGATAAAMGTIMNLYNNSDKLVNAGKKFGNMIVDAGGNMVMKDLKKH